MRYGMMLFIASEVMFFVAFFFDRALFPVGGVWPPEVETFNLFDLPLINTLVLFSYWLYRYLGAPCPSGWQPLLIS